MRKHHFSSGRGKLESRLPSVLSHWWAKAKVRTSHLRRLWDLPVCVHKHFLNPFCWCNKIPQFMMQTEPFYCDYEPSYLPPAGDSSTCEAGMLSAHPGHLQTPVSSALALVLMSWLLTVEQESRGFPGGGYFFCYRGCYRYRDCAWYRNIFGLKGIHNLMGKIDVHHPLDKEMN